MEKIIKIDPTVFSRLLRAKADLIAEDGRNLTFSELIGRLLDDDTTAIK